MGRVKNWMIEEYPFDFEEGGEGYDYFLFLKKQVKNKTFTFKDKGHDLLFKKNNNDNNKGGINYVKGL